MRDHQQAQPRPHQLVHALGNNLQGINVQPRIGLVHHRDGRLEGQHLQNLHALFLAPGKSVVQKPVQESRVHFKVLHVGANRLEELRGLELLFTAHRVG